MAAKREFDADTPFPVLLVPVAAPTRTLAEEAQATEGTKAVVPTCEGSS